MMSSQSCFAPSLLAAVLILTAVQARAADAPQVRQSGGVSYLSGGVSDEGRQTLQAAAAGFDLKLVLATKSGASLSDTDIVVLDAKGANVLRARSEGPWFYAKLAEGRYEVVATANGATLHRTVAIDAKRRLTVDLRWDD